VGTVLLATGRLIVPGRVFFFDGGGNAIALVARLTEDDGVPSAITLDGDGVVNLAGTPGDDRITGGGFDTNLSVSLNGFARAFDVADVTLLRIAAGDGDDHVVLSNVAIASADVGGGNGRDRISGTQRNDTLRGEGGRDFLDGFTGADYLTGGGGKDQLRGQGGNDRVKGGAGDDYVEGGHGNDRLDGGTGADLIDGRNGNDAIAAADGEIDQIFGGGGINDSADADPNDVLDGVETIV
jgi:Ca2+-binding RTX toxin-like protein